MPPSRFTLWGSVAEIAGRFNKGTDRRMGGGRAPFKDVPRFTFDGFQLLITRQSGAIPGVASLGCVSG